MRLSLLAASAIALLCACSGGPSEEERQEARQMAAACGLSMEGMRGDEGFGRKSASRLCACVAETLMNHPAEDRSQATLFFEMSGEGDFTGVLADHMEDGENLLRTVVDEGDCQPV